MKTTYLVWWNLGICLVFVPSLDAASAGSDHSMTQPAQQCVVHGVSADAVQGFDPDGIPVLCGTQVSREGIVAQAKKPPPDPPHPPSVLPSGTRSWECIPGVIRDNGSDTYRLEIDVNGAVNAVNLSSEESFTEWVSGPITQNLRDDGLEGDREAGDCIYTSGLRRYNTDHPMYSHYNRDTNSLAGMIFEAVGVIEVVETSGQTNRFLIRPYIGVLSTNIPLTETAALSSNTVVASHLVNIKTTNRVTQHALRFQGAAVQELTQQFYTELPDAYDFLMFFSLDHIENTNRLATMNFIAGKNITPRVSYSGTGLPLQDTTSAYGSAGRLQGVNILDAGSRGVYSRNATHELVHQWASYTSPALGLSSGDGHYVSTCTAGSVLGGGVMVDNGDGTFTRQCVLPGAAHASPLDKYMMGLIPGSSVPPISIVASLPACNETTSNLAGTVSITDIQAVHGIRNPTPAIAQRDFTVCFIAESFQRLLNAVEMTFYNILASEYTRELHPQAVDPLVGNSWVTIERYFGEGTSWNSEVLPLIRPRITGLSLLPNAGVEVSCSGYPGWDYELLRTTNFTDWQIVTNTTASTNGSIVFVDKTGIVGNATFYRAGLQ